LLSYVPLERSEPDAKAETLRTQCTLHVSLDAGPEDEKILTPAKKTWRRTFISHAFGAEPDVAFDHSTDQG